MVGWLSNWAQGIIVAVIIATIIEMILPNGNSKKYIKVIIGIYILFTIISPILSKVTNNSINVNDIFDLSKYEEQIAKSDEEVSKKIETNNNRTIKDIYISNLETDIKSKLKEKGYGTSSTYIKVKDDENYSIEQIVIDVYKQKYRENDEQSNQQSSSQINIENISPVNINIGEKSSEMQSSDKTNKEILSESESKELKKYLSQIYNIEEKNIEIS